MSQPSQAGLGKQFKIILTSVRALLGGYPWITLTVSLIVGILIGWFALGWGIAPVQWTDARPFRLSDQYQEVFLRFAAETYGNGNVPIEQIAKELGDGWTKQTVLDQLDKFAAKSDPDGKLATLRSALAGCGCEVGPTTVEPSTPAGPSLLTIVLLVILLVVVAGGAVLIVRRISQNASRQAVQTGGAVATTDALGQPVAKPVTRAQGAPKQVKPTAWAGESEPPLAQYVTTYSLGDDRYDVSFSIENENGDFLGECGVGISKAIGVGNPDKITALEVWLFDKTDIQTKTKVLMSEHCFNDQALRTELAPKGEPVLARKGEAVTLLTQTLRVNARIVELSYGSGNLPSNSFFQKVTIELAAWNTGG